MLSRLLKSVYVKVTALVTVFAVLFSSHASAANEGRTVVLKSGTMVMLELASNVNANNVKNSEVVDFRVLNDVRAGGEVVIPAGSMARGQVVSASKSGLFGTPGELSVAVKSVVAVDGTHVPLSSSNLNGEGQDNIVVSVALTVLCLFGFLIKGGSAEISKGAQIDASVLANTEIILE